MPQLSDFKLEPLISPQTPFLGANTTAPASYLPPGKVADAQNFRSVLGVPQVRLPVTLPGGVPAASSHFRGAYECTMDGIPTLFLAAYIVVTIPGPPTTYSYYTGIYKSIDNGATFNEITLGQTYAGSAPFGTTEFIQSATPSNFIEFGLIKDRPYGSNVAYDCLVIQDGTNLPLMYAKGATNSSAFNFTVSSATGNATNAVLTLNKNHAIQDHDQIFVSNCTGNTNLNGSYFAKVTGHANPTVALFVDQALTTPVVGNATYTGSGTVQVYGCTPITQPLQLASSQLLTRSAGFQTYFPIATASAITYTDATGFTVTDGNGPSTSNWVSFNISNLYANGTATVQFPSAVDCSTSNQIVFILSSPVTNFWQDMNIFASSDGTHYYEVSPLAIFLPISVPNSTDTWYQVALPLNQIAGSANLNLASIQYFQFSYTGSIPPNANTYVTGTNFISGGTGYTAGDLLTVSGGTHTTQAQLKVNTVSSGSITSVIVATPGSYSGQPTNNVSVSGGTGTGATFGLLWAGGYSGSLYMAAASGQTQGTAAFAVSVGSSDTRTIGPSQTTFNLPVPLNNATKSSNLFGGFFPQVYIQEDSRFYYSYTLSVPTWGNTQRNAGIDTVLVYRQDVGVTQPYLVGEQTGVTWGGSSWAFSSSPVSITATTANGTADFTNFALDTGYIVPPIGGPMAVTTERLMIGSGSRFWYSGAERPFQFRQYISSTVTGTFQSNSPGSLGIDGENIQQMLSVGSLTGGVEQIGVSQNGISTVYILTDRTLSWVTGWDALSLNKRNLLYARGTYAPKSMAPSRTGFYFLDSDQYVVNVQGWYVLPVSRDTVDTQLLNIPTAYIKNCWGAVRNDRYHLAFTPSGQTTNTQSVVYDVHESQRTGQHVWTRDLFPTSIAGAQCLLAYRDGKRTRLFGFDSAGQCFEHETLGATSDAGGTGVAWSLTFPEMKGDMWAPVRVRRTGLVIDANSGTVNVTLTSIGRITSVVATGTIKTNSADGVSGNRAVRWSRDFPGVNGTSVSLTISGQSNSGTTIYHALNEIQDSHLDPPDVSAS